MRTGWTCAAERLGSHGLTWVERVAQSVPENIEAETDEENREAGYSRLVPGVCEDRPALAQHRPPFGGGGPHAESKKTQRRGENDRLARLERAVNDHGRYGVGKDVPPQNPAGARAQGLRRLDEWPLPQAKYQRPYEPRKTRDRDDGDGEHRVVDRRPECRDDRQGQQDRRKREQHVERSRDDLVQAAVVASDQPDRGAAQGGQHDRNDANNQRDPAAPYQAAERVAA